MSRRKRKRGWKLNEPWTVRRGMRVRVMERRWGTPAIGRRFIVGRVTRLLKQGWGVVVRLPNGQLITRDTQDTQGYR